MSSHTPGQSHESDEDAPHEGPIKTPKQLILAVLYAFVVPVILIVALATYATTSPRPQAGSDAFVPKVMAERIRPVGHVEVKDMSDVSAFKTGEQVYSGQCMACHGVGAVGSPKFGDAAAWGPRIKSGYEALLNSALKGKGAMAAQGGGDYSDLEVGRAVVYMANKGGASFAEPALPAVAAASAAASAP
jgi:cytochrome c5